MPTGRHFDQDAVVDPTVAMILGEVRGQLREIIHTMNNERLKQDELARALSKLEGVPERLEKIERRIGDLEVLRHRRDGASGVMAAVLRSPALAWLIGAAATVWALLHGKVQP